MIYHDLDGYPCEGSVWSAGPLANTAWVRSGSDWVVVNIRTKRQVEYTMPILLPPQPRKRLEWASEVLRSRRLDPCSRDSSSATPNGTSRRPCGLWPSRRTNAPRPFAPPATPTGHRSRQNDCFPWRSREHLCEHLCTAVRQIYLAQNRSVVAGMDRRV